MDIILFIIELPNPRNIPLLIFEAALPLFGILFIRKVPRLSRLFLLATVPVFCFSIWESYTTFFPNQNFPSQYLILGNTMGMAEASLYFTLNELKYRALLAIVMVISKIIALKEGYIETTSNLVSGFFITGFILMMFVYTEVLARKHYKAAYEAGEKLKKFESLLSDDFPISVLIASSDFDSILYSNSSFNDHFKEIISQGLEVIFKNMELETNSMESESHSEKTRNPFTLFDFLKELKKKGGTSKNIDLVISASYKNDKRNEVRHYEIKIRSITWDSIPSHAIILNDISEKYMVAALKLANLQKDRVIATVSHELRTPINGSLGLLEMIKSRVTDEVCHAYIRYCKSCNELLLYLVNSILDLTQIKNHSLKIVKKGFVLDELMEEVKSLYLYQCQMKNVKLIIEKAANVPKELFTDRYRLMEILVNLMGNAVKFTFKGSVTLKIELDPQRKEKVRFSIIDTGIGIKKEDQPQLFQRYHKIQNEDENINVHGVGLGLTIVKELVLALNSETPEDDEEIIDVKSEFQKGSTFSFKVDYIDETINLKNQNTKRNSSTCNMSSIIQEYKEDDDMLSHRVKNYENLHSTISPFSSEYLLSPGRLKVSCFDSPKKSERSFLLKAKKRTLRNVLVVDDNPFNILAASFLLERSDCQVEKAFNGQECIELLDKKRAKRDWYNLILMDIQMPLLDGPEATVIINKKIQRGEYDYVPIIALTAKQSTEDELEYYKKCGILAVYQKPLNEVKLNEIKEKYFFE